MGWTEIELTGVQPLRFRGKQIGTAELRETRDRNDGLALHFETGAHAELPAAVDVSEELSIPRIFIIEGADPNTFMLFGGERLYWISTGGEVNSEIALFRELGEAEYWTTDIIQRDGAAAVVIIYEAGVLMIDEALQVRWHKPKLYNDLFVAVEENVLKFRRDHEEEWFMRLEDGSVSPQELARPLR
jgi:hypothetical protein